MKKFVVRRAILLFLLPILASGNPLQDPPADSEPLHAIGVDAEGDAFEELLPRRKYVREFSAILSSVTASSLQALNAPRARGGWELQTVAVGIGTGLEFGLGPVLKLKATPRIRMIYTNTKEPTLP